MFERCVTKSSPLIIYERVGQFQLLHHVLEHAFIIPPAVRHEVYGTAPLHTWLEEQPLSQPLASRIIAAQLGAGEREALALETQATYVVLDDLPARRVAQALIIAVIGSLGVLLQAKSVGYIDAIRPVIQAMQAADFRASEHVVAGVLAAAGEIML
jgi:hypothetical protein